MVSRTFDPSHTASITPGMPRANLKDVDARIADQIVTRAGLSVQSFAELTAGARSERVLLTAASVPEAVPQTDTALKLAVPSAWWDPADKGGLGLRRPLDFRPAVLVPWLSDALSETRKAKNAAAAAEKLADAQVQALAAIDPPEGTLPEAKALREKMRQSHADATARKAAIERSSGAVARMQAQIAEHERAVVEHRAALASAPTVEETEAKHAEPIAASKELADRADALEAALSSLEESGAAAAEAATRTNGAAVAAERAHSVAMQVLEHTNCPTCSEPLAEGTPAHARLAQRANDARATPQTGSLGALAWAKAARET